LMVAYQTLRIFLDVKLGTKSFLGAAF